MEEFHVIHNLYTDVMGGIKAPEEWKQRLLHAIQSGENVPSVTRKTGRIFKRPRILVFASVAVILAGISVGIFRSGLLNRSQASGEAKALGPRITVNNRIYWPNGCGLSKLPPHYRFIGEITGEGLNNFQSVLVAIGSKIYMDPANPYGAYVSLPHASNGYVLYVTHEIEGRGSVYYNGNLYNFYNDLADIPKDGAYIGTIQSVDCAAIPFHNFESNIKDSLGAKLYQSKTDSSILYVKTDTGRESYKLGFYGASWAHENGVEPRVTINEWTYWPKGYCVSKLPPNDELIGKITGEGLNNFQSIGVPAGSKIYMDPKNPYGAYVSSSRAGGGYDLYVTLEIQMGSICYNGDLYPFYSAPAHIPRDAAYIGTIRSVDYAAIPSRNFESNIMNSLGAKVYRSTTNHSILYVEDAAGIESFRHNVS